MTKRAGTGSGVDSARGALGKAIQILDCFQHQRAWAFTELCAHLGYHKSTVFRLLSQLEESGYLRKNPVTRCYELGDKFHRLEQAVAQTEPLRWYALGPLQELAMVVKETCHIGVLYEGYAITVQVVEGGQALRAHTWVGKKVPAHCSALGKVILAWSDPQVAVDYCQRFRLDPYTPNTITDPEKLLAHLEEVRRVGYAVDNEELEVGLQCVAAPILNASGRAMAGLVVSGPSWRLSGRMSEITRLTKEAAARVQSLLAKYLPAYDATA